MERLVFMLFGYFAREVPFLCYLSYADKCHRMHTGEIFQRKPLDNELGARARQKAWLDHTIIQVPILYFMYDIFYHMGIPMLFEPLPSLTIAVAHFITIVLLCDFVTYVFHRMLHHRWFYKRFITPRIHCFSPPGLDLLFLC